jgi:hypothetical protein
VVPVSPPAARRGGRGVHAWHFFTPEERKRRAEAHAAWQAKMLAEEEEKRVQQDAEVRREATQKRREAEVKLAQLRQEVDHLEEEIDRLREKEGAPRFRREGKGVA